MQVVDDLLSLRHRQPTRHPPIEGLFRKSRRQKASSTVDDEVWVEEREVCGDRVDRGDEAEDVEQRQARVLVRTPPRGKLLELFVDVEGGCDGFLRGTSSGVGGPVWNPRARPSKTRVGRIELEPPTCENPKLRHIHAHDVHAISRTLLTRSGSENHVAPS